jgi:hypothetical protein
MHFLLNLNPNLTKQSWAEIKKIEIFIVTPHSGMGNEK